MGRLVEMVHVTLGGEQGDNAWAMPYIDDEHNAYASRLLRETDSLLLGRATFEGLSAAYTSMADAADGEVDPFVERMNALPKLVASISLHGRTELAWNASVIEGDVVDRVRELKTDADLNMLKYGDGRLSATLARHGLIDEWHLFLTPVAVGVGTHLFEYVDWAPQLELLDLTRFSSGVVVLVYGPGAR